MLTSELVDKYVIQIPHVDPKLRIPTFKLKKIARRLKLRQGATPEPPSSRHAQPVRRIIPCAACCARVVRRSAVILLGFFLSPQAHTIGVLAPNVQR